MLCVVTWWMTLVFMIPSLGRPQASLALLHRVNKDGYVVGILEFDDGYFYQCRTVFESAQIEESTVKRVIKLGATREPIEKWIGAIMHLYFIPVRMVKGSVSLPL